MSSAHPQSRILSPFGQNFHIVISERNEIIDGGLGNTTNTTTAKINEVDHVLLFAVYTTTRVSKF